MPLYNPLNYTDRDTEQHQCKLRKSAHFTMVQLHNLVHAHRNRAVKGTWHLCSKLIHLMNFHLLPSLFNGHLIFSSDEVQLISHQRLQWTTGSICKVKCTYTDTRHLLPGLRVALHFPECCVGNCEPREPCSVVVYNVTRAIRRSNNLQEKKNQDFSIQSEIYTLC